jgi:radical SAM superfamily enzyme YgiQ (UPF0313 family)
MKLIDPLDEIPFPKYTCFDWKKYPMSPYALRISTSRGCPEQCIFCVGPKIQGRRYRAKSPEKVLEEITWLYSNLGTREFWISDPNFTVQRKKGLKHTTMP